MDIRSRQHIFCYWPV
ncbi:hypothetical protein YPPY102_0854, partial [Yersinia pestis PY-102]